MTVCSSEGGIFSTMKGRYDKEANFDVYLKAHAADPIIVDRIGGPGLRVDNPRLSMMLTVQPELLGGIMSNPAFRGRGLCGRFLYALCKSKIGHRNACPDPIPERLKMEYRNFIRRIFCTQGKGLLRLSGEASELLAEYQNFVENKLVGDWEPIRDWGGKCPGAMLRIAGLIHAAEAQGGPAETRIEPETLTAAIRLADFFSEHALAAYAAMGADSEVENAKYLLRRPESVRSTELTKRDLFRLAKGRFRRTGDLEKSLAILSERGFVREVIVQTGGRPSCRLQVNPAAFGPEGGR